MSILSLPFNIYPLFLPILLFPSFFISFLFYFSSHRSLSIHAVSTLVLLPSAPLLHASTAVRYKPALLRRQYRPAPPCPCSRPPAPPRPRPLPTPSTLSGLISSPRHRRHTCAHAPPLPQRPSAHRRPNLVRLRLRLRRPPQPHRHRLCLRRPLPATSTLTS